MFLDRIQLEEDVEYVIVVVDLIYPTIFHHISPFMDLDMREGWASLSLSLSLSRVTRVSLSFSLEDNGPNGKKLKP